MGLNLAMVCAVLTTTVLGTPLEHLDLHLSSSPMDPSSSSPMEAVAQYLPVHVNRMTPGLKLTLDCSHTQGYLNLPQELHQYLLKAHYRLTPVHIFKGHSVYELVHKNIALLPRHNYSQVVGVNLVPPAAAQGCSVSQEDLVADPPSPPSAHRFYPEGWPPKTGPCHPCQCAWSPTSQSPASGNCNGHGTWNSRACCGCCGCEAEQTYCVCDVGWQGDRCSEPIMQPGSGFNAHNVYLNPGMNIASANILHKGMVPCSGPPGTVRNVTIAQVPGTPCDSLQGTPEVSSTPPHDILNIVATAHSGVCQYQIMETCTLNGYSAQTTAVAYVNITVAPPKPQLFLTDTVIQTYTGITTIVPSLLQYIRQKNLVYSVMGYGMEACSKFAVITATATGLIVRGVSAGVCTISVAIRSCLQQDPSFCVTSNKHSLELFVGTRITSGVMLGSVSRYKCEVPCSHFASQYELELRDCVRGMIDGTVLVQSGKQKIYRACTPGGGFEFRCLVGVPDRLPKIWIVHTCSGGEAATAPTACANRTTNGNASGAG